MGTGAISYLPLLAACVMLVGFTFRNQLWLRSFAILGNLVFISYYALVTSQPLWSAIAAAAAIIAVNIYVMSKLLGDRRTFRLTAEEMMLFAHLPGLLPGQFKRLLSIASWHRPATRQQLTIEGQIPAHLYFVLEGRVNVNRDGHSFDVGPHVFIGEVAYLRGKPATATTHAHAGSLLAAFEKQALQQLISTNDNIRKCFDRLLTQDLAEKMAQGAPPKPTG